MQKIDTDILNSTTSSSTPLSHIQLTIFHHSAIRTFSTTYLHHYPHHPFNCSPFLLPSTRFPSPSYPPSYVRHLAADPQRCRSVTTRPQWHPRLPSSQMQQGRSETLSPKATCNQYYSPFFPFISLSFTRRHLHHLFITRHPPLFSHLSPLCPSTFTTPS